MESPISASFRAGASFVPSPVTATTWPFSFKHCTIRSLSNGDDLAITWILSIMAILSSVKEPSSIVSFPSQNSVTFIWFKIIVAEPIVSQAESLRTMALSFIILFIEVRVTASGRPSGIATTTIVTAAAIMPTTESSTSLNFVWLPMYSLRPLSSLVFPVKYLIIRTARTRTATVNPTFPIEEVSLLRRACNGVCSSKS
ncbi:LOW QUALITY PROTEIN: hypothetical protein NC651_012657 [Populus alba x Populus x berolinensis]|nr:LOW QUALITY PROTEIN: hypothetical protein NC651_012657 [Populus alba x Populus x berolinensis]